MGETIDPQHFRHVLGHFPTGVAAVTSVDDDGAPVGMIVGSFTSVSLSPPLVAFLPDRRSTTAPKMLSHGRFCVNVLGAHQETVSRVFTSGGADKFADLDWSASPSGLPLLDDAVAWIECAVETVHEAGDHDIVIGRVTALEASGAGLPLLFFQGGYGRFIPTSLAAAGEADLTHLECLASSVVGEESVLLATAGEPVDGRAYSRVGQRLPLVPPMGAALVAWSDAAAKEWKARAAGLPLGAPDHELDRMLARVRERGWSVTTWSDDLRELESAVDETLRTGVTPHARHAVRELIGRLGAEHEPEDIDGADHGPALRSVTVPVFDVRGEVVMQISLRLPPDAVAADLDRYVAPLTAAARRVNEALVDAPPARRAPRPKDQDRSQRHESPTARSHPRVTSVETPVETAPGRSTHADRRA
jgi:flavin reductase (DIM6/NTAB) family NADH-FMN oxidoreductase RutF/DNA-binding IclR family transcriptional regulator